MNGISWCELPKHVNDRLSALFRKKDLFLEYNPGKLIMTTTFKDIANDILKFEVKKDDVWFISYPRTGSTWCQEMVWLIGNNLDYERAKSTPQYVRAPVLEMISYFPGEDKNVFKEDIENSLEWAKNQPQPRYLKTHLRLDFLPSEIQTVKPKIIYSIRNTKDVAVSFYHHMGNLHRMDTSFDEFMEIFTDEKYSIGSYWKHLAQFSKMASEPNVLILKYEEMIRDCKGTIRKTAKFLEKEISERQVDELCDFLSFDSMKENKAVNYQTVLQNLPRKNTSSRFIRNGKVDDWKNYFTDDLSSKFDKLNEKYSEYDLVRRANSLV